MAEPLMREVFGAVLRRSRLRARKRLVDVAADAGVSVQYLSEIERGKKEASSEILAAICGALDADVADLLLAGFRQWRVVSLTPARLAPQNLAAQQLAAQKLAPQKLATVHQLGTTGHSLSLGAGAMDTHAMGVVLAA